MLNEGLKLVQMRQGHTNKLQIMFRTCLCGQKHAFRSMSRNSDSLTYQQVRNLTSWTASNLCVELKFMPIAHLELKIMKNKRNLVNAGVQLKNSWKTHQMMTKCLFGTKGNREGNPQGSHAFKNIHLDVCQGIAIP